MVQSSGMALYNEGHALSVFYKNCFRLPHFQLMDVRKSTLAVRERAIGMSLAGSTQKTAANTFGVTIRTIRN